MDAKKFTIRIESILGGHSSLSHFARVDQFLNSVGVDPAQPSADSTSTDPLYSVGSGILRPVAATNIAGSNISNIPRWFVSSPKGSNVAYIYIYDSAGSAYSMRAISPNLGVTALSDGGSLDNSSGNGCEYYNNYIYFAKNTTIARYGPLDTTASPTFDGDYWSGTLGKTPLTNTTYPYAGILSSSLFKFSNHFMHRHSDGKLYFGDVVGNQGTLHIISTSKTTIEGDTDAGSTYSKLQFGYGLWPTCIESYGSDIVTALVEDETTETSSRRLKPAKIAFWDTTSQNFNNIIWVEFPDPIISAMKNIDGVLYVVSGGTAGLGIRLSRFVGGYTFEEVAYFEYAGLPLSGAIDGNSRRVMIGTNIKSPMTSPAVISYGLQKSEIGQSIFYTFGGSRSSSAVTALMVKSGGTFRLTSPVTGWSSGITNNSSENGIDAQSLSGGYDTSTSVWWSQIYKLGQPFKITKIRIPLAQSISGNMIVTPKIYTDEGNGTTYTLTTINNTNDSGLFNIIRRSGSSGETITGKHNFWLALEWTGADLCVVGLPITIEYELIDD